MSGNAGEYRAWKGWWAGGSERHGCLLAPHEWTLARIQVFILDIDSPDMHDYELARRLRAKPQTANAVLIALTGYGQAHERVLLEAAGFHHHLVKPNEPLALTEILNQVAQRALLPDALVLVVRHARKHPVADYQQTYVKRTATASFA